jgi:hypothetical protein
VTNTLAVKGKELSTDVCHSQSLPSVCICLHLERSLIWCSSWVGSSLTCNFNTRYKWITVTCTVTTNGTELNMAVCHCYPLLPWSIHLPLVWSPIRCSSLTYNDKTSAEVTNNDKHCSLNGTELDRAVCHCMKLPHWSTFSLPLVWSPIRFFSLTYNYKTSAEVTNSDTVALNGTELNTVVCYCMKLPPWSISLPLVWSPIRFFSLTGNYQTRYKWLTVTNTVAIKRHITKYRHLLLSVTLTMVYFPTIIEESVMGSSSVGSNLTCNFNTRH